EEDDEERACLCEVRGAIRAAGQGFGPVQRISPPTRAETGTVQVVIGSGSEVTAAWSAGLEQRWTKTSGGRFGNPARLHAPEDVLLSTLAGRPEAYFTAGGPPAEEAVVAAPVPLGRRRLLGRVPGQTVEPGSGTLTADRRGDLVVVGVEFDLKV